ncbi:STAS domain-containing protein [Solimonas flava]|uniref:STAS domain-containing protein n=1 Tax=Solimonas flava TaxID=415849 RepID=UPI000419F7E7|nr:STAS domain-containing protein [Solimonas flava]
MSAALSGALSFSTAEGWFARADELAAAGTIDLANVTQCDSAGAALLLELRRRALSKGQTLAFINATPQLRGLITFFGLQNVVELAA